MSVANLPFDLKYCWLHSSWNSK